MLFLTLQTPWSSYFFQSAYSHRHSSPEILKDLAKPHSRKRCAGVSLDDHQCIWHFWLLTGSVRFIFLVFTGQCSAVAGWQAVGERNLSRTRRCASLLRTPRWRGLSPFFRACLPSCCLFPSLLLLPASSGQERVKSVYPPCRRALPCNLLGDGWMELPCDGRERSPWCPRGQASAQLDVSRANAHLAQRGLRKAFHLFRPVRISLKIFSLVFALSREGKKPVRMLHGGISPTTGVPCVHLLLPGCQTAARWLCQVFWKAAAERSKDFDSIYRRPATLLLEQKWPQ